MAHVLRRQGKVEEAMLFYFTATGNSLYVAKQLDPRYISIAQAIHDELRAYEDRQIGIVCPVHVQRMPELVAAFLRHARFDTAYFYIILTYGSRYGNAPRQACDLAQSLGIQPAYVNVVWMADNFLPEADIEEETAADKQTDAQIAAIQEDLHHSRRFIAPEDVRGRRFSRLFSKLAKNGPGLYHINEDCIGCGICQKICPMDRFTIQDQKSKYDPNGCIGCMACIHACPMSAIRLNTTERNHNARYRNEHISLCEIIDANNQHRCTKKKRGKHNEHDQTE